MRQRSNQGTGLQARNTGHRTPDTSAEPLAENRLGGGGGCERKPHGFYSRMGDDELVEYAKRVMAENGISCRKGLEKGQTRLYQVLLMREKANPGLMARIGLEERRRDWKSMSDEDISAHAQSYIDSEGIRSKSGFARGDPSLFVTIRRRGLLERLRFEESRPKARDWASMSDAQIIAVAKGFIAKNGIAIRAQLEAMDVGLYTVLMKRSLMDGAGLPSKTRPWSRMQDEEILRKAAEFIAREKIASSGRLKKEDSSMYLALCKRGLLGALGLERKENRWDKECDGELLSHATALINEHGVKNQAQLQKKDSLLLYALRRRGLLERAGLPAKKSKKARMWRSLSDDELLECAKRFTQGRGVTRREEVERLDGGLHAVLYKRKLYDRLFAKKRTEWSEYDDDGLLLHAKGIVESEGIASRTEFQRKLPGLYNALRTRKIFEKVGIEPAQRPWSSLSDEQVLGQASGIIAGKMVTSRAMLRSMDASLYEVLRKRGLLEPLGLRGGAGTPLQAAPGQAARVKVKSDDEVLEAAARLISEKGIGTRKGLEREDTALYATLSRRGLLDRTGLGRSKRDWASMGDDEIVEHTKKLIAREGIGRRKQLQTTDGSLYAILCHRRLMDRLGLDVSVNSWSSMSDAELIGYAERYVRENRLQRVVDLVKSDGRLYRALQGRGIIAKVAFPMKKKERRDWDSISDSEVVRKAKELVSEHSIKTRSGIREHDQGLFYVMRDRRLFNEAGLFSHQDKDRPPLQGFIPEGDAAGKSRWALLSDEELVAYAADFIRASGIATRQGLSGANKRLYTALLKRRLMERTGLARQRKDWSAMDDDALVRYAQDFIDSGGARSSTKLMKCAGGLWNALNVRGLIEKVRFQERRAVFRWSGMSDAELEERARAAIRENGYTRLVEFRMAQMNLYRALQERGLAHALGLMTPNRPGARTPWAGLSDEKLVRYAKKIIRKRSIRSRGELCRGDSGLYAALIRRKLIDFVGLERKVRNWAAMGDEELLLFATGLVRSRGIRNKSGLTQGDASLYGVLKDRGLLGRFYSGLERERARGAVGEVIEALEGFSSSEVGLGAAGEKADGDQPGDDGGAASRSRTSRIDEPEKLRRTFQDSKVDEGAGLLPREPGMRRPQWALVRANDRELIDLANSLISEHGIRNIRGLEELDIALVANIRRRGLLGGLALDGERRRKWARMSDEELLAYARKAIETNAFQKRSDLSRHDQGLYETLRVRKLLGSIGLESKNPKKGKEEECSNQQRAEAQNPMKRKRARFWSAMGDAELRGYAERFIAERGIKSRTGLYKADQGLHAVLIRRRLLDSIEFEERINDWASLSDKELVESARGRMGESGITTKYRFSKAFAGLYGALAERGLIERVGLGYETIRWGALSHGELVEHGKRFVAEKGISSSGELSVADSKLYSALCRRRLLESVFPDAKSAGPGGKEGGAAGPSRKGDDGK